MQDDPSDPPGLSDLQLALMRVLWARGEASTADVTEDLRPSRSLAHTTVATLLTRLEKRGLLEARRDGRVILYRAKVAPEQVQRSMVGGLLSGLFGGRPSQLLAHLVNEELSDEELGEMRKLLAQAQKRRGHA